MLDKFYVAKYIPNSLVSIADKRDVHSGFSIVKETVQPY